MSCNELLMLLHAKIHFFQAQPQIQLSWAELALILKYPASPFGHFVTKQSFYHKTVILSQSKQGI